MHGSTAEVQMHWATTLIALRDLFCFHQTLKYSWDSSLCAGGLKDRLFSMRTRRNMWYTCSSLSMQYHPNRPLQHLQYLILTISSNPTRQSVRSNNRNCCTPISRRSWRLLFSRLIFASFTTTWQCASNNCYMNTLRYRSLRLNFSSIPSSLKNSI